MPVDATFISVDRWNVYRICRAGPQGTIELSVPIKGTSEELIAREMHVLLRFSDADAKMAGCIRMCVIYWTTLLYICAQLDMQEVMYSWGYIFIVDEFYIKIRLPQVY